MSKKINYTFILFTFALSAGATTYVVKHGETLSVIVQKNFPEERIFGKKGKLHEVLSYNSSITDPDDIYPGQSIVLKKEEYRTIASETPVLIKPEAPIQDEWLLSLSSGARYMSINQTGDLGNAALGVVFLNDLKFKSLFSHGEWKVGAEFETYKFKYATPVSSGDQTMNALDLNFAYKWFGAGFSLKQIPVFKNNNGNIDMLRENVGFLNVDAYKEIALNSYKPTHLKFQAGVSYPVSATSSNLDAKVSSIKGYGAHGDVELRRQITKKEDYQFNFLWNTNASYMNLSQQTDWGTRAGTVKLKHFSISTSFGVQLSF